MKIISPLLVIFCSILAVKSKTCLGSQEKSIISGIKSAIKTLEEKLEGKSPRFRAGWKEYKDHCYFFSSGTKPWHEAERECRLIDLFNISRHLQLRTTTTEEIQQFYWIGATDFKECDWRWANDLSKVHFTSWSSGQPDNGNGIEDCAHIWHNKSYKWNDAGCQNSLGYLCESPQGSNCLPYSSVLKSAANGK